MKDIRNLVFDMDGVLWHGMRPVPELASMFKRLEALGINYALATNNASRTVAQYVEKFAGFGIEMAPWRILSSAETTGTWLADQYPDRGRAYVVGGDGLHYALSSRGFEVVSLPSDIRFLKQPHEARQALIDAGKIDLVVIGFTPAATYADLAAACYFVQNGARFIGSNPDLSFPSELGRLPGAGSLISVVENATRETPTVIGKPFSYIYEEALKRLESTPSNTAMVGDRLDTDIAGAIGVSMQSILVLSGISTRDDIATGDVKPDYVFDGVGDALNAIEAANRG